MTTIGRVFPTRKPLVPLTILDGRGHRHPLQFILDTGFTGELVLPEQYVRRFGLIMDGRLPGSLSAYQPAMPLSSGKSNRAT